MKDLAEASFVNGIEIHRDRSRDLLGLFQGSILKRFLKDSTYKNVRVVLPLLLRVTDLVNINFLKMTWKENKWTKFLMPL